MGRLFELTAADGHTVRAYRAGAPDQPRGIILCHESSGLNRYIRRVADRVAALGFSVIAPALFDRLAPGLELGYLASDLATGRELGARITPAHLLLDISAAVAALGIPRVAIVGLDWGGTAAWRTAARLPVFRAAVAYYPLGIGAFRQERPLCPAQLHMGALDDLIPAADIEAIRIAYPDAAVETYHTGAHGFACEEQEAYNAEATEAARDNTLVFLREHMDGARAAAKPAPKRPDPADLEHAAPLAEPAPVAPLDPPRPLGAGQAFTFGRKQAIG
jgi:carboxymethylenebutenolidase